MSLVHIETNNPVIRVFPVRNNRREYLNQRRLTDSIVS